MKNKKLFLLAAALLLTVGIPVSAQEGQIGFTPYSIFGLGDLATKGSSYNLAMAGIGVGDRNVRAINLVNPAAVTAREAKSFLMDFGIENRNVIYKQGDVKSANNTFNMHHLAASFPIYKNSAFKLGIMPYSSVEYDFMERETRPEILAEMGDVRYYHQGKGHIYNVFLGAGATFWNKLSVGVDGQYYFGNIDRSVSTYFTTNSYYRTVITGTENLVSAFGVKFGLQYTQPFDANRELTVGATYSLATKLKGGCTEYSYGEASTVTDTISIIKTNASMGTIPGELAVGISYRDKEKWMVGFDYSRSDWKNSNLAATPGVDFKPVTANCFRLGMEFTPNRYDVRYFFKRWTYRAGAYRNYTYMSLNGKQVVATGLTLGFGIPVWRYYNAINLGVDIGQKGSLTNGNVRERYALITLSFNLHDIWFIKPLYN